jgi:hypothetical protein
LIFQTSQISLEAGALSGSDAGSTRGEIGPPETGRPRFELESVDIWDSANDSLHEGSQRDFVRLVRRVTVKHRRIHKLLKGRKKLAIQRHLIIPKRENPTYLRRERSLIRLREAVLPENAGNRYQVSLDRRFLRKTTTEHARPASKLSAKNQTFLMLKRSPSEGCSTRR